MVWKRGEGSYLHPRSETIPEQRRWQVPITSRLEQHHRPKVESGQEEDEDGNHREGGPVFGLVQIVPWRPLTSRGRHTDEDDSGRRKLCCEFSNFISWDIKFMNNELYTHQERWTFIVLWLYSLTHNTYKTPKSMIFLRICSFGSIVHFRLNCFRLSY